MKAKYCYIIVEEENGNPLVESEKLPIFWLKKIASQRLNDYRDSRRKYIIRSILLSDIESLILNKSK